MDSRNISNKVKQLHFISRKLVDTIFAGNYHSVFKGPGLEFDEVREYSWGDDPRFIDWNVTSRMSAPYTKTFREEREVVLQVGCLLFSDKIEEQIPPRKGKKHVLKQITQILSVEEGGRGSNLALALSTASQTMKRRGICMVLSDFRTSRYKKELSLLARKHDVIAVRLTDPLDNEFPSSGLISLEDPESGLQWQGVGTKKMRASYREFWDHERYLWRKTCQTAGVDTLEISTEDDPAVKLLHFFERRKKH
ncbi:MAG: hypothetical protein B6241_12125 [Spirochaetaceae bacterium 4572_59]|nr:MAG: hypothetical protein B6241_12125 [Spirochaetaceae bacterium 4572_59]